MPVLNLFDSQTLALGSNAVRAAYLGSELRHFNPKAVGGLAIWLDGSDASSLYTTDAGPVEAVSAPTDVAGCEIWLDGDQSVTQSLFDATSGGSAVTTNGGSIARWEDKSGNGRHFVQSSATLRPTLSTAARNDRSVVTFDATDDYMISDATQNIPQPATWLFVYKVPSDITSGWSLVDSTTDRVHVYSAAGATITQYTAGGFFTTESTGVVADQWRIGTYRFNGASSLGRKDGVQTATGTTGTNAITGLITLGANNGGATVLRSQIAEAILLTSSSIEDIARVEAYLAAKWGISEVHTAATSGAPVGYWKDKSGNNRHATQGTGANQPTLLATGFNGKPTLEFDITDSLVSSATIADYFLTPTTSPAFAAVLACYIPEPASAGNVVFGSDAQANGRLFFATHYGGSNIIYDTVNASTGRLPAGGQTGAGWTTPHILTVYRSGAVMSVRRDGVEIAGRTDASGNYSSTTAQLQIGKCDGAGVNVMYLSEMLVYASALSETQLAAAESGLARKWGVTLPPQVSNADAQEWVDRVYANGGTVSESTASAVNTFCNSIDAAGIRDRFYRLNLFAGTGLNAALVPLYRGPTYGGTTYGNATDTNNGPFVSDDYVETGASGGLLGNGSSKYLNTGFDAGAAGLTSDSVHMATVWPTYTHPALTNAMVLSVVNAAINQRFWLNVNSVNTPSTGVQGVLGQSIPYIYHETSATNGGTIPGGLWTVSRTSNASLSLYEGATSRGFDSAAIAVTALPSTDMTVFVRYNGTDFFGYAPIRLRAYSAGLGMTEQQVSDYNDAMTSLQTALGRT